MASTAYTGTNHGLQIGKNYGSLTAEFHLPPERPETPPSPGSTVPFQRDPDFVNRDILLRQIDEKTSVPGCRIALVGLGGVGKSQLVIEYCYRIRSLSSATWVFWIHASSAARFEQGFRDMADYVKIPGRQNPNVNIFTLVQQWLRDEKKGNWVLILDNVDDDWFISEHRPTKQQGQANHPTQPLFEYIPRSLNGRVIVTTRASEVAMKIVDRKDLILVEPMARSEALELMQKKLEFPKVTDEVSLLVEELEFMPLAITQAAAFITARAPRYSVSQYLEKFRKSDREATRLLNYEGSNLYRDWEAKSAILITWQISFDRIRRMRPSAADLLSLMSFFDRHEIPESLLHIQNHGKSSNPLPGAIRDDHSEDDTDSISGSEGDYDFEDDIATLTNYSFISIGEDGTTFRMHRLVQLTAWVWLKTHGQMEHWKEQFITRLCQEFPHGNYENWELCRSLFPHVKSALLQRPESEQSIKEWATLLYKGAYYAWSSGHVADVRKLASKSRDQRLRILGAEADETLESTLMLARAYTLEEQWEEAEKLDLELLEIRKAKLGENHPSTLARMVSLGDIYQSQCKLEKAETQQRQATEALRATLGEDHLWTLISMSNLATTLSRQDRWEEANKLHTEVVEISTTKLGADNLDTLAFLANLVSVYNNQGRWDESERL
ncbi:hypothetical protein N7528_001535 [Penicillium herquei]|nr:hypothetical protein N7528_001535 [Penicillium herquei]